VPLPSEILKREPVQKEPESAAPRWSDVPMKPGVLPEIVQGLQQRGWSADEIDKVLSGNFFRGAQSAWK
jgi:microsomal dipeptidase-like Zn-dependent dipeptidase